LFDALLQGGRGVVEQQVRFVEHEDEPGLLEVADFRHVLEQLRQQPQQEGRIQPRFQDQLVRREDADHATAVGRRAHQVGECQARFAEELFRAVPAPGAAARAG
jgi:hypothetical protein